jgi:hypothetical protein
LILGTVRHVADLAGPVLAVDGGEQDRRPRAVVVRFLVRRVQEVLDLRFQHGEAPLADPNDCARQIDIAALARFPGLPGRGDVRAGDLQYCGQKLKLLRRRGSVAGWLDGGRCVDTLGLSAGRPAILADLDEAARFKLRQVVIQAVRRPADQRGKLTGRAGPDRDQLEEPDPQRVGERPVNGAQPRRRRVDHVVDNSRLSRNFLNNCRGPCPEGGR